MPAPETIRIIRLYLFGYIRDFADADTQQERWFDCSATTPYYTFAECMCHYFDDAITDAGLQAMLEDGFISSEEFEAIKPFHCLAERYNSPTDDYDHLSILRDPAWHLIQVEAKRTCDKLRFQVHDAAELDELQIQNKKPNKAQIATPMNPSD